MADENATAQEAPESNALEQSGNFEVSAPAETNAQSKSAQTPDPAKDEPAGDQITISKEKFDEKILKAKAIAERKARRELETKMRTEQQQAAPSQQQQQSQVYNHNPPSPDHIWDINLGWIHKDTTREEYSRLLGEALSSVQIQNPYEVNQAPAQPSQATHPQAAQYYQPPNDPLYKRAEDQIDECAIELDDFEMVAKSCFNDNMVLAAASMPGNGIKELYEEAKRNPMEMYKIMKLSADEQKFRVRDLLREKANAPQKVVTSVEAPPEDLNSNGAVKDESELSYAEKKARANKAYWHR